MGNAFVILSLFCMVKLHIHEEFLDYRNMHFGSYS